ncbi:MAG: DNA topoisomerase VI subunit B [Planctomycetes bacterium]|nr:DNA topoisomerase VI subunit B [Planctomycetota bacterium]
MKARARRGQSAEALATKQREISISEFFSKNRHLLGFDNRRKALLTAVKEAVDNALDACEEAGVAPDVRIEIEAMRKDERYRIAVEDNGPGIVPAQVPKIFGQLLYGSRFHTLKQARGQQGIGISAAGMYGQLTTGKPMVIVSRTGPRRPALRYQVAIDTARNRPEVTGEKEVAWDRPHGTRVEIELEGRYHRGRQSVEEYLKQTSIANPHVDIRYRGPDGTEMHLERVTTELPEAPLEIKPHPHGVELGRLIKMLKETRARTLGSFLRTDFSRVGEKAAAAICAAAGLEPASRPGRIARTEADRLIEAIRTVKLMAPAPSGIVPIGEALLLRSLKSEIPEAAFYTACTRSPAVYRGNPFQIEVGLAYGGALAADDLARVLRFANRVPLLHQPGACLITRTLVATDWKHYGLAQARGALPTGPLVVLVHLASVWVPFTSESKEAIADYTEIQREIRLAVQECGRRLRLFVSRRRRAADAEKKRSYIEKYIPHIGQALQDILALSAADRDRTIRDLSAILEKSRKMD